MASITAKIANGGEPLQYSGPDKVRVILKKLSITV